VKKACFMPVLSQFLGSYIVKAMLFFVQSHEIKRKIKKIVEIFAGM